MARLKMACDIRDDLVKLSSLKRLSRFRRVSHLASVDMTFRVEEVF